MDKTINSMETTPPKKRRFSFSLRTLMVFMLALCILFGTVGRRVYRAREQQAFLRELEASGWTLYKVEGRLQYKFETPGFWELVIQSNFIDLIDGVSFSGMDEEDGLYITPLLNLKNLEWVNVSNTQVSDLTPLAKLKNLEVLDISNTQVSDLTPLTKLLNLKLLFIYNTQVNAQQIQQFQRALPNCKMVFSEY